LNNTLFFFSCAFDRVKFIPSNRNVSPSAQPICCAIVATCFACYEAVISPNITRTVSITQHS